MPLVLSVSSSAKVVDSDERPVWGVQGRLSGQSAHVRFGSKADMTRSYWDVRFAPESGHETDID